jgi:hypothetical protein
VLGEIFSLHRVLLALLFAVIAANVAIAANAPLMVTPGQFNVSATGAATYNIPISVPPVHPVSCRRCF